jgi:hypothetical protein
MKRIALVILAGLSLFPGIFAQNVDDALRYSQIFYGGTARFISMGGAFTALGGDMSTFTQNPAGIGVFRSSEMSITPQLSYNKTETQFNGYSSDYLYNFNLNQAGFVTNLIKTNSETGLVTLNFGYSFNKTNNFNQSLMTQGISNSSSMADYWAQISDGIYFNNMKGTEGYIAYDTWIIDTLRNAGASSYGTVYSNYGDNPGSVYGQKIRKSSLYDGYTGEHAITIGGNYANKIMFGATFGINTIHYTAHTEYLESTDLDLPSKFKNFTYSDYLDNSGTGFSFKAGAIIKPVEFLRIGLAFHTPTWYHINEYYYDNITSTFTDGGKYQSSNDPLVYKYKLATPFRALAGVAVQIQKIGLVSVDYEFVDYSSARFSQAGDGYNYYDKNQLIKGSLRAASNLRVGGELRLNKLYLRSGYGYYGKAFKQGDANQNLDYRSLSFGIGYREQNISVDFAYTNFKYSSASILYPLNDSYPPANVNLNAMNNMFTLTLGYKLGI